jgi:parvulin-like peptidyl-prolyl isomerase
VIRRPVRHLVALLAVLLVALAAGAGCSSTMRNAATVRYEDADGEERVVHIRRDNFEDDLRALAANDALMQGLAESNVDPKPDSSTVDADLSALWLTTLIQSVAIESEFEARGLEITDAQREQAGQALAQYGDLSDSVRDTLTNQQAQAQALAASFGAEVEDPPPPTEQELRELYEQSGSALAACTSGKEVSHILVEDQATADQIVADLAAGASFAELATNQSTDTGSAQQGGSLGCLEPGVYVAEFQQAADTAPLDQVVGPVQTEFGYHVILVTPWDPSFEKLRPTLEQQLTGQAQQQAEQQRTLLFNEALQARLESMDVDVDPRFGTWSTGDQGFRVTPPEVRSPRDRREPATTTTTAPLLGP